MGVFSWLRNKVRQAIVDGAADALAELDGPDAGNLPESLADRLRPQLPAPEAGGNGAAAGTAPRARAKGGAK